MTPRTRMLLLVLAGAMALGVGVGWKMQADAPATAGGVAAPAPPGIPPVAPPAALPASLPPLPPADARPVSSVGPLQTRADAGDGVAACRLAVMLMRCQIAAKKGFDDPGCEALAPGLADRAQHYLRAAALAGEPNSLFLYANGTGFEAPGGYGYLRTAAFDQWRREAGPMMQRAFANGDPRAALVLGFAHGHDVGAFAGLIEDDAVLALAHKRLAERLFGASLAVFPLPMPLPREPLAEEASARAEALANDWHRDYFGGRQVDMVALIEAGEPPPWSRKAGPEAMQGACLAPLETMP